MSIHSPPHRIIHCLAIAPITAEALSQRTKLPASEVENLLKEYATKTSDDLYTLADNRYKDLRIWEFRYNQSQRAQVIADSIKAFDALNVPKDHPYRRNLIDPKVKKAEAEAIAAEKEAKRRAIIDAEAAEKLASEKAASDRLVAERAAAEQAKARQSASVAARRAPTSGAVSSPSNGYSSATSMLQKVTKIGSSNNSKKQRSTSSSSNSSTEAKPVSVAAPVSRQSANPYPNKRNESDDGYSSSNGPITSSSRGKLKATAVSGRTKSTSPNPPSKLGTSSPTVSPLLGAVGSTNITKKRKLPSARASTPGTSTPSNGVSIRTKRVAVGVNSPTAVPAASSVSSISSPAKLPSPPRPPRAGPDEDMFALAELFRQKYTVYEKLYRHVSNTSDDDQRRLRKLISLHRELESVKKKLWAVSPPSTRASGTKKDASTAKLR